MIAYQRAAIIQAIWRLEKHVQSHFRRCVSGVCASILCAMNQLTIVTKLRLMAAIAPAILLLLALFLAEGFYIFGGIPRSIIDNQYASVRAAEGMDNSLFKMDWGRSQPDGPQIVLDQTRRFI